MSEEEKDEKVEVPSWWPINGQSFLELPDTGGQWLIKDFIKENGINIVSGQPKRAVKTHFTYACAVALATGKKINLIEPVKQGPVVIIQEEGTLYEGKRALRSIIQGAGIEKEELSDLHIIFRQRVNIVNPTWNQHLMQIKAELKPKLWVFDTLNLVHTCDENSASEFNAVFDAFGRLRGHDAATLSIVHLDKNKGASRHADLDSQIRGSGAIAGSYDWHVALRRYSNRDQHIDLYAFGRGGSQKDYKVMWEMSEKDETPEDEQYARINLEKVCEK